MALPIAVVLALQAAPAHAYLDPGAGSYVFQMLAAALISAGFVLRAYWHRVRALFKPRTRRDPTKPPDAD